MKRTYSSMSTLLLSIVVVAVIFCIVLYRPIDSIYNQRTVIATVTEKVVKNTKEKGIYLIFAVDENGNVETFEITDALVKMRFNSSDVYADIKVGCQYKFTVGGTRNGFMSWYPNIYDYVPIETE